VKGCFAYARYATGAFALLTLASMFRYPGGTYLNRDSDRYLFLQNFLSELGMPRSWGGEINPWGALLFVAAEVVLAIGFVSFFVGVLQLWSPSRAHGGWAAWRPLLASSLPSSWSPWHSLLPIGFSRFTLRWW